MGVTSHNVPIHSSFGAKVFSLEEDILSLKLSTLSIQKLWDDTVTGKGNPPGKVLRHLSPKKGC